jgi:hypothetical protein
MRGRADIYRARRKRRFGLLLGIAAGLMAAMTAAPARAADLELPSADKQILDALKAKRLTRCPQTSTQPRCGGARLQSPSMRGRLAGRARRLEAGLR